MLVGPWHRGEGLSEVELLLGIQCVWVLPGLISPIKDKRGLGAFREAWVVVGKGWLLYSPPGVRVRAVLSLQGLFIA